MLERQVKSLQARVKDDKQAHVDKITELKGTHTVALSSAKETVKSLDLRAEVLTLKSSLAEKQKAENQWDAEKRELHDQIRQLQVAKSSSPWSPAPYHGHGGHSYHHNRSHSQGNGYHHSPDRTSPRRSPRNTKRPRDSPSPEYAYSKSAGKMVKIVP